MLCPLSLSDVLCVCFSLHNVTSAGSGFLNFEYANDDVDTDFGEETLVLIVQSVFRISIEYLLFFMYRY